MNENYTWVTEANLELIHALKAPTSGGAYILDKKPTGQPFFGDS